MTTNETATEQTATIEQPAASDVLTAKTICLSIERGRFGAKRKASLDQVTVESDKNLLALSKRILDSPELKAIEKHDGKVNRRLKEIAHSSGYLRGGNFLVSIPMVKSTDDEVKEFIAERETLVAAACGMYEQRCQETRARLNVLGSDFDYPPVEVFRAKFYFRYRWVAFTTPERLKQISPELFEMELNKHRAELASIADDCRNAMRVQLLKLVSHMRERMQPDEEGKPKKFAKNTVENINEFLNMFELKDATADSDLAAVVKQARAVLKGVDAKTLKSDDLIKAKVDAEFAAIQTQLETMVVEAGARAINLDDEDSE